MTPLMHAVKYGSLETVEALLELGASVHAKDTWLYTPLHFAALRESESMIKVLLKFGAQPHRGSGRGRFSPFDLVEGRADLILAMGGPKVKGDDVRRFKRNELR